MGPTASGEDRRREPRGEVAAWAAAAVVVAIGALGFAVAATVRADDLADRLDRLEASPPATTAPGADPATSVPPVGGATTTSTVTSGPGPTSSPLDQAAARAGAEDAFRRAYDGAAGAEARLAAIDDPTGIEDALRRLFTGPYGSIAATSSVTVRSVQFTGATRASVDYTLAMGERAPSALVGEARVVAGEWKVTRATVCRDLQAFGAACGG